MRFLIINTDYPAFLKQLYARHPGLAERSYDEQYRVRMDSLFGIADFYSTNLRRLGHEAWDVIANAEPLQRAWAAEQGIRGISRVPLEFCVRRGVVPWVQRPSRWMFQILEAQIRHYRPDVLVNHALVEIPPGFWRRVRPLVGTVVGQHPATTLPPRWDWAAYDLVVSSFPPTVEWFRRCGVRAEYLKLGFEPSLLTRLGQREPHYDVTFVGSFHSVHRARTEWLEKVCEAIDVHVWTPDARSLSPRSPLRRNLHGAVWGEHMFRVLAASRITLNHHGSIPPYANNMRLYEATGAGTLLVTDWKPNLAELFEPEREVIAYRTPDECAAKIRHYLEQEHERRQIADAGQCRTRAAHTYEQRMVELVNIVQAHLDTAGAAAWA
jgi:hypothetical protein